MLRRMPAKTFIGFLITAAVTAYFIINFSSQPGSVEVRQGQRIMYQMMGQETLQKAGFFRAHPAGDPSDFVSFVNTPEGRRLWPATVSEYKSNSVPGAGRDPHRVLQPDALCFSAHQPDPAGGPQIVYLPHDDTGQMEIRGYDSPDAEPVFTYTWDFPTDAGEIPLR